ncbi:hypothetical protein F5X68DRAFT_258494 [Plectosphaerella plurivora]|uniref:SH3 domain-containing protein n=1 Tax=Plectosphaerella plurivora TaxID=936078 RepID=A0A9P8VJ06_9PEZI|nr:hypothetical protein F5X68DRAFT_258494 [Plectosphaerella plurivora]
MAVDAEELVTRIFREVVERGNEAVAQAEDVADEDEEVGWRLLKAGQALVKEGERAIKRLKPLLQNRPADFSDAVKRMMIQNADIMDRQRSLDSLLYDFDDYMEVETFEGERFAELQSETKAFALVVMESIRKVMAEAVLKAQPLPEQVIQPEVVQPIVAAPTPEPVKVEPIVIAEAITRGDSPVNVSPIKMEPPSTKPEPALVAASTLPPPAPRPSAFPPLPPLPPMASRPESRSSKHSSTQSAMRPSTQGRERPAMPPWPKPPPGNMKLARSRSGSAGGHSGPTSPTSVPPGMQDFRPTALRPPPSPKPFQPIGLPLQHPPSSPPGLPLQHPSPPPAQQQQHYRDQPTSPYSQQSQYQHLRQQQHHQYSLPLQRPQDSDTEAGRFDFGLPTRTAAPRLAQRPSYQDLSSVSQPEPERPARNHEMERMSRLADTLRMPTDARYNPPPVHTSFLDQEPYPEPPSAYNDRRLTGTTASDRQSSNFDATSPLHSNSNRTSAFSNATSYTSPTRHSNNTYGGIPRSSSLHASSTPGELREKSISSLSERENNKLMLVEEWASTHTATTHDTTPPAGYPVWRTVDMKLGVDSSFIVMKGFCKGATLFKDNGPGEGVKKLGGAGNAQAVKDFSAGMGFAGAYAASNATFQETMAQCTRCEYTHKYSQLMQDLDKDSIATLQAHGLRYRRRFLYKAHMHTGIMTKAYYACPFCVHTGSTPREGDATVFTSALYFLRHVARHPQPLPEVPGLTVLYGTVSADDPAASDFDVHLLTGPMTPGYPLEGDASARAAMMPVMLAVKDHVQLPGERPLERPDRTAATPLLQFFSGARIVGVEFPEQWGGKWCTGWHDGDFGAFPIKNVQLETPRRSRMGAHQEAPVSRRTCVTKWKFDSRSGAGTGWLPFEKGETLTNLEWDDPEAWFWVATNKKGKWGIFPSSHVKMDSVKDGSLNDSSSSITKKKSILPW